MTEVAPHIHMTVGVAERQAGYLDRLDVFLLWSGLFGRIDKREWKLYTLNQQAAWPGGRCGLQVVKLAGWLAESRALQKMAGKV